MIIELPIGVPITHIDIAKQMSGQPKTIQANPPLVEDTIEGLIFGLNGPGKMLTMQYNTSTSSIVRLLLVQARQVELEVFT